jgi:hypothetical protein
MPTAAPDPPRPRHPGRGRRRLFLLGWCLTLAGSLTIEASILAWCAGATMAHAQTGVLTGIAIVAVGLVLLWLGRPAP